MTYTMVLTEIRGRVGIVTLNRPQVMNAFNTLMLTELFDALEAFDKDENVGAMVVTGNEKAFAAGADIKEMAESTPFGMIKQGRVELWDRIRGIRKIVIAAVSGWALGGGCEFAISCDMIVASETAKFGQPEVTIGITPGGGGTQRLARLLGKHLAMEMIINNRTLTAAEALQFGLVKSRCACGWLPRCRSCLRGRDRLARAAGCPHGKGLDQRRVRDHAHRRLESREAEFLSAVFNRRSKGRHEGLYRKTKTELEGEVVG